MDTERYCCFTHEFGPCHKQTYTQVKNLIEQFDANDLELLSKRTNLKKEQITNICAHHHQMLIVR